MRVSIKLLAAALFLVVTTAASAQMREQRIEHTIVSTQAPEANHIQPHLTSHRAGQSEMGHDPLLPFTVTLEADTLDVSDAQEHAFQGTITNISHDTITIFFKRYQSLPCGWITSVCFGANCYSTLTDSASYMIPPVDSAVHSIQLTVDVTAAAAETATNSLVHITIGAGDWASNDTVPLKLYSVYNPSDPPRIFSLGNLSKTNFNDTGLHILSALVSNLSCSSTKYQFHVSGSLPQGWELTKTCAGNDCSSNGIVSTMFDGKGGGNDIVKLKVTLDVHSLPRTDSTTLYISVHPQTDNSADSAIYPITVVVNNTQSGVSPTTSIAKGLKILTAWPNPLHLKGNLNLDISAEEAGTAIARVFDISGNELLTFPIGELSIGDNHVRMDDLKLPSGDYVIRIEQSGGAFQSVRLSYVK